MTDTKQKILDPAERVFAQQGYAATSLRQIIAQAGVNLAAIHYHFGSKEELLDGVLLRKVTQMNDRRLGLLAAHEAEAGAGRLEVEKVLDAFLTPIVEMVGEHPDFVRLMGRLMAESELPEAVLKYFQPILDRFTAALTRALPDLPPAELAWRMQFVMGAVAQTICGSAVWTPEHTSPAGLRGRIRSLAPFLAAGLSAPPPATRED